MQRCHASLVIMRCRDWPRRTWHGVVALHSVSSQAAGDLYLFRGPRRHSLAGVARVTGVRVLGCALARLLLGGISGRKLPARSTPGRPRRGSARRMARPTSDLGMQRWPVAIHIVISDPPVQIKIQLPAMLSESEVQARSHSTADRSGLPPCPDSDYDSDSDSDPA